MEFPVQTILSGPAASVMGILTMTGCSEDAIALDIGGTTTDIAIFADGVPLLEPFGVTIEGHKTLIRGLRTKSDRRRRRQRRPPSGGKTLPSDREREGPAAAFGGPFPTPTDAMIVLGMTDIGDRDRAAASLRPIADALHCPVDETAGAIFHETCRQIAAHVREVIEEINNQPVYTIHEMLEGKRLNPRLLYVVGGPAEPLAAELGRLLELRAPHPAPCGGGQRHRGRPGQDDGGDDPPRRHRTADPDHRAKRGSSPPSRPRFTREDAIRIGREKLREKALKMGAAEEDLEIEVVEAQEFNMVREYYTTGKNIRVKVQIKPGASPGSSGGMSLC